MTRRAGRRLRIGVDAACLANPRGYGRFARELLHAMARADRHDLVLFADARAAEHADIPRARLVEVAQRVSPSVAAAADGSRTPMDMLRFSAAVWRESLDVFFSPSVYSYFPLPPRLPAVVTIHDAIADRFPALTLPSRRARLFWRAKTRLALAQSRLVLTVSPYAARELTAVYGIPARRLRVAVEAPAAAYRPSDDAPRVASVARDAGVPSGHPWFAYVGGINPHKRVESAVRALASLAAGRDAPPHLVLVGPTDDVFHGSPVSLDAAIRDAGIDHLVHRAGFLPDDALRHLLSGAVALLLPSESEGFGLPAVEAAACGTPVVATTASPLPELLEGGGIFVPPGDARALAAAMARLLDEPGLRERLGERARLRAGALSWDSAATATLDALEEAAA
jgi:glycosyltransferase involved in cell wall biosynthesis